MSPGYNPYTMAACQLRSVIAVAATSGVDTARA